MVLIKENPRRTELKHGALAKTVLHLATPYKLVFNEEKNLLLI